jgi:excisionase family DNA binding protein
MLRFLFALRFPHGSETKEPSMPKKFHPRPLAAPEWENVKDTCAATGLSRGTVWKLLKNGRIQAKKFGPRVLINIASRKAFIDALPGPSS